MQVLAIAVNSGLVTYPTEYKKLGYASGLTVWEPLPPEHYVALGHVASTGEEEPSVKQVNHQQRHMISSVLPSLSGKDSAIVIGRKRKGPRMLSFRAALHS